MSVLTVVSKCDSCQADVYWGRTKNDKPCPFNDPEQKISHFSTCPNASRHSKKNKAKANPRASTNGSTILTPPPGPAGHACINQPDGKQTLVASWHDGLKCLVKAGTKFQKFQNGQDIWEKGQATKDLTFEDSEIVVNPYLKEFTGTDLFGSMFTQGQFCFKRRGWFMVVNMFDVVITQ